MDREKDEEAELAVLQAAIDKGRASGVCPGTPSEIIAEIIREYHAKHG